MWTELNRALARFPDAVLTGLDPDDGGPVSVRCRPRADDARQVLRCARSPGIELADGPASVLGHSHDEHLWQLRSFLARGHVATTETEWLFTPSTISMGTGMAGPLADLRSFVAARRRAGRYLTRRGLPRPAIPWHRLRPLP